jgi:dihydrofolate reductase
MTVTLVAAVARNGVIGAAGGIPWKLPGEQAWFKATTMGHVLVIGRRTYESIGRPLPGRTTIVVTRNPGWLIAAGQPAGVLVASNVRDALARANDLDDQVYVAGGAQVYAEAMPYADELHISEIDAAPDGDTLFPAINWNDWALVGRERHDGWDLATYRRTSGGIGYRGRHGDHV